MLLAKLPVNTLAAYPYFMLTRVLHFGMTVFYNLTIIAVCFAKSKTLKTAIVRDFSDLYLKSKEKMSGFCGTTK